MIEPTRGRTNDLRDDEDHRVIVAATAFRQAREGKPHDPWEWLACSQDDVDRARELIGTLDDMTAATARHLVEQAEAELRTQVEAAGRQSAIVCDGCHATIERIMTAGHFGACVRNGRHQHHVAHPISGCLYWQEWAEEMRRASR